MEGLPCRWVMIQDRRQGMEDQKRGSKEGRGRREGEGESQGDGKAMEAFLADSMLNLETGGSCESEPRRLRQTDRLSHFLVGPRIVVATVY